MLMRHLYRCIWLILQFLIDVLELFNWLFVFIRTLLLRSYDKSHGGWENLKDYQTLKHCQGLLSKKPNHIAIIVGPAAKHVNQLFFQRLFTYALQMEISCISIYDTRNTSENNESLNFEKINMPKYMQRRIINEGHCHWTVNQGTSFMNGELKNGKSNGNINTNGDATQANGTSVPYSHNRSETNSLEIFQFTMKDNISSISAICRELYSKRHTTEMQEQLNDRMQLTQCIDDALTQRLFGSMYRKNSNIEPELCIVVNAYLCTFGMLPWHTRFTEFYNIKSGAEFDANTFSDILYRYSRCQQRWGK